LAGLHGVHALVAFDRWSALSLSARYCVGLDEAGRGPLAGPLAVALYVFDTECDIPAMDVNDSKKMSHARREKTHAVLTHNPFYLRCAFVSPADIDSVNIYRATQRAMESLVSGLPQEIFDNCVCITDAMPLGIADTRIRPLIKADTKSYAVAAASIIAKVERDRIMNRLANEYPDFGFERHKGYPTVEHIEKLRKYGPTPVHRMSYAPVKNACNRMDQELFTRD